MACRFPFSASVILTLSVFGFSTDNSPAQATFQRTFGGTSDDRGFSAIETTDGGFVIVGQYKTDAATPEDQIIVKVNSDATTYWVKTIGGASNDYVRSVVATTDGGYLLAGHTTSYGSIGANNIYAVKANSSGNSVWGKAMSSIGGANIEEAYSVVATADGGYILSGHTNGYGAGSYDVYMISVNSDGTSFWGKVFGTASSDKGRGIIATTDGGYAIAGQNSSVGSGDMYFIKTNSDASSFFTATFGSAFVDFGYSVVEAANGDFILAGETGSNSNMYLVRLTSAGAFVWSRSIGLSSAGTEDAKQILETTDGGFIIVGSTTSSAGFGNSDVLLVKTGSDGVVSWAKAYGGTGDEFGHSVQICADGGYLLAGYTNSFGSGGNDLYLIKTDGNGTSNCNEKAVTTTTATITTNVASSGGANAGIAIVSADVTTTPTIIVRNACNNSTLLPVDLVEMGARCEGNRVIYEWMTAQENGNERFRVERSVNGGPYQIAGTTDGHGYTSLPVRYRFEEDIPENAGSILFRLVQMDYDGKTEVFGPVAVECSGWLPLSWAQAPALSESGFTAQVISKYEDVIRLGIMDALGRPVFQKPFHLIPGINSLLLEVNPLPAGIYYVQVHGAFGALSHRVLYIR